MSTPTTPDYRMRFPPGKIDFAGQVGTTGQDHDSFPSPSSQARFDWMRMVVIALLSNQASYDPPTQYREGTIWLNLNTPELMIWLGSSWEPLATAIRVNGIDDDFVSLLDLYTKVQAIPNSSLNPAFVTKTSAYTLGPLDSTVFVNAGTTVSITLPSAAGLGGHEFTIKTLQSAVTILTSGGQLIDGNSTYSMATRNKYVTAKSDGVNWQIVGNN